MECECGHKTPDHWILTAVCFICGGCPDCCKKLRGKKQHDPKHQAWGGEKTKAEKRP